MIGAKDFLTVAEVADLQGLSTKSVIRAIKAGELVPIYYNPRVIRIPRAEIVRWVDRRKCAAPMSTSSIK